MNRGPKSKLTPTTRSSLVESIRVGLTKALASSRAGISQATLCNWLAAGRDHRDKGRKPLPFDPKTNNWEPRKKVNQSIELELLEAIERAESDRIAENFLVIRGAAKGGAVVKRVTKTIVVNGQQQTIVTEEVAQPDWKASAWIIERTRQSEYGSRLVDDQGLTGGGKLGGPDDVLRISFSVSPAKADTKPEA